MFMEPSPPVISPITLPDIMFPAAAPPPMLAPMFRDVEVP